MTGRAGGVSLPPFDSFNLRDGLGDDPHAVRVNRARLHDLIGRPSAPLAQVHGVAVHTLELEPAVEPCATPIVADAVATASTAAACEIQVADCLPVLFAHVGGRAVGAAHAGWRGLAGGVLEATLARVCELAQALPHEIECWLGPCIGPGRFEVGAEVLVAFGAAPDRPGPFFQGQAGPPGKWLADLPALARQRLAAAGATQVQGNDGSADWCTLTHPRRYFSYRHAARTGRMAALVWLDQG